MKNTLIKNTLESSDAILGKKMLQHQMKQTLRLVHNQLSTHLNATNEKGKTHFGVALREHAIGAWRLALEHFDIVCR